jgi:hypothetical protein
VTEMLPILAVINTCPTQVSPGDRPRFSVHLCSRPLRLYKNAVNILFPIFVEEEQA